MKTLSNLKGWFNSALLLISCLFIIPVISAETGEELHQQGEKAEENGNLTGAITYYLMAADQFIIEADPGSAGWSYFDAGEVALELKKYNDATGYFVNAATQFIADETPANASFANTLAGYSQYKIKQFESATGLFQTAATQAETAEVPGNAAFAYDGAGHSIKYTNWAKAQEYWNKAKTKFQEEGMSYTIPGDLEIEIETPSNCKILIGNFYHELDEIQQGEAIKISGKVLFHGKPVIPDQSSFYIKYTVPGEPVKKEQKAYYTDETGSFELLSIAGYSIGMYSFIVGTFYTNNDLKTSASDTAYLIVKTCEPPPEIDSNIEEIIRLFNSNIPSGPIRTEEARKYLTEKESWYINLKKEYKYGDYHNFYLAKTKFDPKSDYTCTGYQNRVLTFLNRIQFNKDPNIRKLMKGLDYGPIARGPKTDYFIEKLWFHAAVVLYPIGSDWKTNKKAVVLDPWFLQKPQTYTVEAWKKFGAYYGSYTPRVDDWFLSENNPDKILESMPMTGNEIYINTDECADHFKKPNNDHKHRGKLGCPVTLLISNADEELSGVNKEGIFFYEFPVYLQCSGEHEDSLEWYFELPEGNYELSITGHNDGIFNLELISEINQTEPFIYGPQSISKNETATILLGPDIERPSLILPDGTEVDPVSEPVSTDDKFTGSENTISGKCYPNPFNESVQISYQLNRNSTVKIAIYDLAGRFINSLLQEFQHAGEHTVCWDGTDASGIKLKTGIYFYTITTDDHTTTQKMFLVR